MCIIAKAEPKSNGNCTFDDIRQMGFAVSHQATRLREALVTHLADCVALARVRFDVSRQATGLIEALVAHFAGVRFLTFKTREFIKRA